jgi:CRISPR-associated protein Csd1
MESRGEAPPEGYTYEKIKYRVSLSPNGKIVDIFEIPADNEENVKKLFPANASTTTEAFILEIRSRYLFGLEYDNKNKVFVVTRANGKSKNPHDELLRVVNKFYKDLKAPLAQAYLNFVNSFIPENETENLCFLKIAKDFNKAKFDFCLSGSPSVVLEELPEVKAICDEYYISQNEEENAHKAICPIYGEKLPVARTHYKISGLKGGKGTGCILVCFNNDAENSYGKEQAYNSGISRKAMCRYTSALDYLIDNDKHKTVIGNLTILHFALKEEEEGFLECVNNSVFGNAFANSSDNEYSIDAVEANLKETVVAIKQGNKSDFTYYDNLDDAAKFYIFGLVPNKSRIAVKFSYVNTFGQLRKNLQKFNDDFVIGNLTKAPKLIEIMGQLERPQNTKDKGAKSKKNKNKEDKNEENKNKETLQDLPSDITERLLGSILNGTPFPSIVMQILVRRIKTDSDADNNHYLKMNDVRIGLLKACLNRKCKNEEEKITPMLNEQNKNSAYLCGRLFAVLEKVQQDSAEGKLNRTIKDAYFSSAAATPAVIFARLMKLSQNHLAKLQDGQKIYYNKLIGSIIADLPSFPTSLDLTAQSNFIIGYYQQNKQLYTKTKEEN